MKTQDLLNHVESVKVRGAWEKGVKLYAEDLLSNALDYDYAEVNNLAELRETILNGAEDWKQYAAGGLGLVYNSYIAERLCSPSELKKTDNGRKDPNARETWIDVEARALYQAWLMIRDAYYKINATEHPAPPFSIDLVNNRVEY